MGNTWTTSPSLFFWSKSEWWLIAALGILLVCLIISSLLLGIQSFGSGELLSSASGGTGFRVSGSKGCVSRQSDCGWRAKTALLDKNWLCCDFEYQGESVPLVLVLARRPWGFSIGHIHYGMRSSGQGMICCPQLCAFLVFGSPGKHCWPALRLGFAQSWSSDPGKEL